MVKILLIYRIYFCRVFQRQENNARFYCNKSKDLDCLRRHFTWMYIIHKGGKEEVKRVGYKGK